MANKTEVHGQRWQNSNTCFEPDETVLMGYLKPMSVDRKLIELKIIKMDLSSKQTHFKWEKYKYKWQIA
jgi:hypothetical protein